MALTSTKLFFEMGARQAAHSGLGVKEANLTQCLLVSSNAVQYRQSIAGFQARHHRKKEMAQGHDDHRWHARFGELKVRQAGYAQCACGSGQFV